MDLLILGGTEFLGRHLVATARERGHAVTVFNRGRTNPGLFADVTELRGDRDGGLAALEGGAWDAAIDTSGYVPRVVRDGVRLLADAIPHYTFISSISVYASFAGPVGETSPVAPLDDPASEDVGAHYGPLKARCENVVREIYGGRALVIRPGLIVGPHDPTGRFTYWPARLTAGGEVLAPGRPERPVQFIDARDLATWTLHMVERRAAGVFNATGPEPRPTMGELLDTCRTVAGSDARLHWVDDAFLRRHEVGEWVELPLWIADPAWQGLLDADVARAVAAGLAARPLEETVRATLAWWRDGGQPASRPTGVERPPAGLTPDREAALLREWSAA